MTTENGLIFFVGPEKGFSAAETAHLSNLGAVGVSLHKNILRTDTAPLCALSQIAMLGSWKG
jgi:16S rRNA (uracil1498-N3)-methyltransferase